jgi:hypothetical protein
MAALSEAVGQYELKGNRVAADRARRPWPDTELAVPRIALADGDSLHGIP